jgi:multidrug/hemolysin transport system ATP-binding protein
MIVEVDGLTKHFGDVLAVDGLDLEVEEGTLFAFLGPNGAGKSTTISCLTTLMNADSGRATIAGLELGRDDASIRRKIGVVFQDSVMDPALTVRENLVARAALYGVGKSAVGARIAELSDQIELGDFLDQRYATLSGGQRRRADIGRALVHRPPLIFLDEPTGGLDPQSREQVWLTINALRAGQGTTVFLTTHYLAETEDADNVMVIDHGHAIAEGTPGELRERFSTSLLTITPSAGFGDEVRHVLSRWDVVEVAGGLRAQVDSSATARAVLATLGDAVADFEFRHGTMDDVFLSLTEHDGAGEGSVS